MIRPLGLCAALLLSTVDPTEIATRPAYAQEQTQTVVVTGLGKDARSALQNAAENALTQVSGTFVRTDTTIERTSEIRGAIRGETRRIDNRMSEYAQGTISSIQILSTSQDGTTTRVEARVSVRVSELKAFIESLDVGTAPVGAEVAINSSLYQRRATSVEDIVLDTIVRPIVTGTALRFEIGKPFSVKDATDAFEGSFYIKQFPTRYVAIPIKVTIDSLHVANSLSILSRLSDNVRCYKDNSHRTLKFYDGKNLKCYDLKDIELSQAEKAADQGTEIMALPMRSAWKIGLINQMAGGTAAWALRQLMKEQLALSVTFSGAEDQQHVETFKSCSVIPDIQKEASLLHFEQMGFVETCFLPIFPDDSLVFYNKTFFLLVDASLPWFQETTSISVKIEEIPQWR